MATEKRAVLVRFYPEVHKKLQSIAKKDKRTVTNLVEYLIETSLSKIEPENKKASDAFSYSKSAPFGNSGNEIQSNL